MNIAANLTKTFKSNPSWVPFNSLLSINLYALIEKMRGSLSWAKGELKAKILLNSPKKQIVLTLLHKNTEVVSIQSSDSITFQVIEGRLKLESKKRAIYIDKGRVLTLCEKEEYTLSNSEETAYLLTMVNKN